MSRQLRDALNQALCGELESAMARIVHCVNQLSDEQVWSRPPNGLNAIGNLLLHLTGNVQQMIANNLSGALDIRDRPAEFAAREAIPKSQLLGKLVLVVGQSCNAIRGASDERLCQVTLVNKNNLTGVEAAVRSIAHFRGHTQEIIHMTRTILGEKYQYAGPK